MYVCRGRRFLGDSEYREVYDALVEGRLEDALHLLREHGGIAAGVDLSDLEEASRRILEIADRRVGCGQDLTGLIENSEPGVHSAECPRCGLVFRWEVV